MEVGVGVKEVFNGFYKERDLSILVDFICFGWI
jgi:hypothetical protein